MNTPHPRLNATTLLYLLLPPLFWAGNAVVGRATVGAIPPLALSFWRWAIAFVVILPFTARPLWRHRQALWQRKYDLIALSVSGVGIYNSFQYLALQTSPAINVALIASAGPIFTLMAGALLFKATVTRAQLLGALVSILGVLWVAGRGSLERILALHLTPGDSYILFAIAVWAIYTWLLKTRRPPLEAMPLLAAQIGIGTLAILPFYLLETFLGAPEIRTSPGVLAALLYVGLLPSLAAYWCWDKAVSHAGATLPTYFINLIPVFAALLAVVFLNEQLATFHFIGGILIFSGIVIASWRRNA